MYSQSILNVMRRISSVARAARLWTPLATPRIQANVARPASAAGRVLACLLCWPLVGLLAQAGSAADTTWQSLTIYPPEAQLATATDFQNVIAVAQRSDGVTLDVTEQVAWTVENPELVRFEDFRLSPTSDGQTKLLATWQELKAEARERDGCHRAARHQLPPRCHARADARGL